MKGIQFVIIYLLMEFKYQKNGKINNIKILKKTKIFLHKQCCKLTINKFQIMKIIMIHLLEIIVVLQLQCI